MGCPTLRELLEGDPVVKPDLGTKRTCANCGARFYDLDKSPVVCPKCEHAFMPDVLLPSKEVHVEVKKPVEKPVEEVAAPARDDVEVVSLNEIEDDADDADDDDVAAIEDVDLGDDDIDDDADEDAFLEDDDEEDSDVSGLLGGVADDEEV